MFRLYIACLASYNEGILYGKWIEVSGDIEELREEIKTLLENSPVKDAEEWAIHDHEGFDSYKIEEYSDLTEICEHVTACLETDHDLELIDGVICSHGFSAKEAINFIDDNYLGEYDTAEDWAEEFLKDTGDLNLPRHLSYYFDYSAYVRDCEINGDILTVKSKNGYYILWNN